MENNLREQYEFEKQSAIKLLKASRNEREVLYSNIYEEFYRRYPYHRNAERAEINKIQVSLLKPYITENSRFLEIGGGNLSLSKEISKIAKDVIAIEASEFEDHELAEYQNLRVHMANLPPYGLEKGSIDLAYSCHFIEHIHPEDALDHVMEIFQVLSDGGAYICITPNRVYGPHDVSRNFDRNATGLHLKEYSHHELKELFQKAGFTKVNLIPGIAKPEIGIMCAKNIILEHIIDKMPHLLKQATLKFIEKLTSSKHPFRPMEQIVLIAHKEND